MDIDAKDTTNMNDQQPISRRQMLGTITATAGFTATGLLASPASGNNASVEIVTLRKGDGTPERTAKVPQKWLQHEKQAREEVKQLEDRYSDKSWVESVGVGPSNIKVAGKPASVLQVNVDRSTKKGREKTKAGQKNSLPDSNGIPVETRPINNVKSIGACYHNGNYGQVWGGDICGRGPNGGWGTAGYYVRKNGSRYLLHCNHVFGGDSACIDPDGMDVYQGGGYLGKVIGHHQSHDWVVIGDQSGSTSFSSVPKVWVGGKGVPVKSWVTKSGLHQFKSNKTPCYQQGVSTGLTNGQIYGIAVSHGKGCISLKNSVELNCNVAAGDSGGPIFMTYNNGNSVALIAHTNLAMDVFPDEGLGYGCAENKIEPNVAGWPTWRFVNKDYGGQYTIDTA